MKKYELILILVVINLICLQFLVLPLVQQSFRPLPGEIDQPIGEISFPGFLGWLIILMGSIVFYIKYSPRIEIEEKILQILSVRGSLTYYSISKFLNKKREFKGHSVKQIERIVKKMYVDKKLILKGNKYSLH